MSGPSLWPSVAITLAITVATLVVGFLAFGAWGTLAGPPVASVTGVLVVECRWARWRSRR